LAAACRAARGNGQRVRALYVAPDFANPSGAVLSRQTRVRLLGLAEEHDFFVLEDNAYGFTAPSGQRQPALKALGNSGRVIHIATFAKIGAPGARVGFLIADQAVVGADGATSTLASKIALVKSMVTVNTSPICQAIVGGLLLTHGGSLLELAAAKADLYRRNLRHLLDALHTQLGGRSSLTWTRPAGGFFVRMGLPVVADVALLERSAAEFGVLWTPMSSFYLDSSGDQEIRLSCSYLSAAEIDAGVSRLVTFLRSLPETGFTERDAAHD
jgi:(S)-3,5-dihydroxyphenylglycine transaminase